jgi:NitT/TauT family transport system substrate-binding protein
VTIRRWFRALAITAAAALIAGACGGNGGTEESGAQEDESLPEVVFQGFPADPAALPMFVMQEEGLDEKYGFRAEYLPVDPDAATNTFLIGESDIAMEQDGVNMTIIDQEGQKAYLFAPGLNMMTGVVVAEASPYQTPEDLVGEKVGHFGVDSGTTSTIALMLKEIHGLDVFNEYDLREAGPEALPELLKNGEVEAIFDYEPLALRAVLETPGRYLFEPTKAWAEHTGGWSPWLTNLAATEEWLQDHPPELTFGIRNAWMEAIGILEDSNYKMLADDPYASFLELKSDEELEAFIDYCADLPCFATSWTQDDIRELMGYLNLMVENDILIDSVPEKPVGIILEDYFEMEDPTQE